MRFYRRWNACGLTTPPPVTTTGPKFPKTHWQREAESRTDVSRDSADVRDQIRGKRCETAVDLANLCQVVGST